MIIGIVGHEAAKFTPEKEAEARDVIRRMLTRPDVTAACSGACHLGGIDIWTKEIAEEVGLKMIEYPARRHVWSGPGGFCERNVKIATTSDVVYCIAVTKLPETYTGMRFELCYHCGIKSHAKSGGCWTAKHARKLGKVGETIEL